MPRLKFDLVPLDRNLGHWKDREEHEAWVREYLAKNHPGVEPRPCDCGYFGDDWVVMCEGRQREDCHRHMPKRLEHHYREEHLKALRAKRQFPGVLFPKAAKSHCQWCDGEIRRPNGQLHPTRRWHPDCLHQYFLHTRSEDQQAFLLDRDDIGCKGCGATEGRYVVVSRYDEAAVARDLARDSYLRRQHPDTAGAVTIISWRSRLEVDHIIALARVAHFPDEKRRFYFGPANLQLLCSPCHKAKTKVDTALIRAEQRGRGSLQNLQIAP